MSSNIQTGYTKKGQLKIRLSQMPNEAEVNELNRIQSNATFTLCDRKGYKRLLVKANGGFHPPSMEAPIKQWFQP